MLRQGTCAHALVGVATAAAITVFLAGSAMAQASSASLAPPKNYRQQIAAKLQQMEDASTIQYVGITQPKQMFVGLLAGGIRPAVCVQVERPNIFGARAAWYYLFYFENGQVDGYLQFATGALQQAMQRCEPPLAPMTDLVRQRRKK